jgi:hypothetical protein
MYLVAGLTPWRQGINSNPVHLKFVVDNRGSGTCFLRMLNVSLVSTMLHVCHMHCFLSIAVTWTSRGNLVRIFRQSTDMSDIWGRWTEE